MKKIFSCILVVLLLLTCAIPAYAVDNSREYFFELSVDGSDTKNVQTGDIITVVFTLYRTDSENKYDMYSMQNEIRYDSSFFKFVEGSELLSNGISTTEISLRGDLKEFYMNFVSFSGGEKWNHEKMIGSFQLEVIAESGVSKITNQDYLVSTADGKDTYKSTCQDVTVILSTDCVVEFETNGGNEIEDQIVIYGETIEKPEDPHRDGYEFVDWYSDIDLKNLWDFEKDTVDGNITLYAKWQKAGAQPPVEEEPEEEGFGWWWLVILIGVLGILLLIILLLWRNRKTVNFESACSVKIKPQKIKKGGLVERPADPRRLGRTFAGWYMDEARTIRWDFEYDKVEEDMTLYAKWI